MSLMLTRMFAYFTLVAYLVVGTLVVRFYSPKIQTLAFTSDYLSLVSDAPLETIADASSEALSVPEMKFAEIKIPVPQVIKKVVAKVVVAKKVEKIAALNELPFHEPVTVQKVFLLKELPTNLVASYKDFSFQETIVAETEVDEVSTKQAQATEVEPEFFDYSKNESVKTEVAEVAPVESPEKVSSPEIETENVADLIESEPSPAAPQVVASEEPEFFDYETPVTTQAAQVASTSTKASAPVSAPVTQISGVAFDYSRAQQDIAQGTVGTVSGVTTQPPAPRPSPVEPERKDEKSALISTVGLSIKAMGSDLKVLQDLQGFEVRFQDDLSETMEDFGAGEVRYETTLSQPKMTRSATLLKRGYVPTSTEIILEEGTGSVSIPMLQDDTFNKVQEAYERNGSIGALLVELDDESELAKLDVPFGNVIKLNGDFKKTEKEDFRYQLFVGVKSGNAMLSYHRGNGEIVSKIVHIHENEMTYDANFYEEVINEKVRLYEEDLLAKETSPLIVSGEQVKVFAKNVTAKKVNNHTYKMNFGASHLGGRRYLELAHQSEPVFVGMRDNNHITVPSENFMRFILSKLEGSKLGNRCLVQVNLNKKAEKVDVASESVASSLQVHTQMLDSDGKFYDSLSDKTQKVIIVGDAQGSEEISPEAKINVKIQYQDGTTQFLNSYCSPNTYLVEQL